MTSLHYTTLKGVTVENSNEFWSTFYADPSRMMKDAIHQHCGDSVFTEYDSNGNEVIIVHIGGMSFADIIMIIGAVTHLMDDLKALTPYCTPERVTKFTEDGKLIIKLIS